MGAYERLSKTYDWIDDRIAKLRHPVLYILIIGLILRFLFLPLSVWDSGDWARTAENIVSGDGFYHFRGYYYGPGFGYLVSIPVIIATQLFAFGTFTEQTEAMIVLQPYFRYGLNVQTPQFQVMFKCLMIAGDVMMAFLVRWLIKRITENQKTADAGFALVFLSPIVLIESSIHGMFDVWCGTLALLSIYFVVKEQYTFAGAAWMTATLLKLFSVFLFPVLIAYILKKYGKDLKSAIVSILKATAGALICFVMLYWPQALDGTFDRSWEHIFGRAMRAGNLLDLSPLKIAVVCAGLVLLIGLYIYFKRCRKSAPKRKISIKINPKLAILAIIALGTGLFGMLVVINGGINELFTDVSVSGNIIGIAVQGLALILSFVYAKKMYDSKVEDRNRLLLLVSILAVSTSFLWVPMPQYMILILPMICVYAMVYDRRYLNPFFCISVGAAFYIVMVESPIAMLMSLAQYTDLIDMDTIVDLEKVYVGGMQIGEYGICQVIFCAIGAAIQLIGVIMLFVYRFKPYREEEEWI